MGVETRRSMRGPHPAAGPTVSFSLASWLPARTRAWPTISFVPLASSLASNPVGHEGIRDAAGMHIAQAARAFETALNERALQIHLQRIPGSYVRADAGAATSSGTGHSAAMELTPGRFDGHRDEDCDRLAGYDSKPRVPDCRRQDGPTVGRPCWLSRSRRSPPMPTSLA
jgi:hypothetical protein